MVSLKTQSYHITQQSIIQRQARLSSPAFGRGKLKKVLAGAALIALPYLMPAQTVQDSLLKEGYTQTSAGKGYDFDRKQPFVIRYFTHPNKLPVDTKQYPGDKCIGVRKEGEDTFIKRCPKQQGE